MPIIIPQCFSCKHLYEDEDIASCPAFPEQIPKEILFWELIHDKKHEFQVGNFLYEEKK